MTEISKLKDEEYCESKHKLNHLSLSVIEWCYNVHLAFDISITTWYKSIVLAFFNKVW